MLLTSTYSVKIKEANKAFEDTATKYRELVSFFVSVAIEEHGLFERQELVSGKEHRALMEKLTLETKSRPVVPYPVNDRFYKFPSYLRRAAIAEALGMASSYFSNLKRWESSDASARGEKPSPPTVGYTYPAMYRDNCFVRTGTYTASLKVWTRNTWDWVDVRLRKSDVDYIRRHCGSCKECVPTLRRRGKNWYLDFAFQTKKSLSTTPMEDQIILAVDLGINSACTCSAMDASGTVLRRYFYRPRREEDLLAHRIGKVRRANRGGMKPAYTKAEFEKIKKEKRRPLEPRNVGGGSRKTPRLWASVNNMNWHISEATAQAIIDFAADCHADVIVFEHLDLQGKKKGTKMRQRLHLWRARDIQKIVEGKAHRLGLRVSRVCAWNTSKLAFDGSGEVERGVDGNYSICKFKTGKVYNCDLSASYNIGARYFIRETLRDMSETTRLAIEAKVPGCAKRSTATLSSLISLRAEIASLASPSLNTRCILER